MAHNRKCGCTVIRYAGRFFILFLIFVDVVVIAAVFARCRSHFVCEREIFVSILSSHKYSFGRFERVCDSEHPLLFMIVSHRNKQLHSRWKERKNKTIHIKSNRRPHFLHCQIHLQCAFSVVRFYIMFFNENVLLCPIVLRTSRLIAHFCSIQLNTLFLPFPTGCIFSLVHTLLVILSLTFLIIFKFVQHFYEVRES